MSNLRAIVLFITSPMLLRSAGQEYMDISNIRRANLHSCRVTHRSPWSPLWNFSFANNLHEGEMDLVSFDLPPIFRIETSRATLSVAPGIVCLLRRSSSADGLER